MPCVPPVHAGQATCSSSSIGAITRPIHCSRSQPVFHSPHWSRRASRPIAWNCPTAQSAARLNARDPVRRLPMSCVSSSSNFITALLSVPSLMMRRAIRSWEIASWATSAVQAVAAKVMRITKREMRVIGQHHTSGAGRGERASCVSGAHRCLRVRFGSRDWLVSHPCPPCARVMRAALQVNGLRVRPVAEVVAGVPHDALEGDVRADHHRWDRVG